MQKFALLFAARKVASKVNRGPTPALQEQNVPHAVNSRHVFLAGPIVNLVHRDPLSTETLVSFGVLGMHVSTHDG